jgi:hypothetical protein
MARKIIVFFIGVVLLGCESRINPPEYAVNLPSLPPIWEKILGPPRWRLQWIDSHGRAACLDLREGEKPVISVLGEWATPVLAHPYWPDRGLSPGILRPAGAVFPFDVRSGRVALSWRAGPAAWFYRELAAAGAAIQAPEKRHPELFDWPRFRSLLASDALPEAIREDPWKADWREAARRTVESGFDRRRIKERAGEELSVTGNSGLDREYQAGPWMGASPFAAPVVPDKEGILRFSLSGETGTWFSPKGVLRISRNVWNFYPWEAGKQIPVVEELR